MINILYIFSVIGIVDTLYLIYHKFAGTDVACIGFPKEWCKKVQYSRESKTFGVPNSYAGFVIYLSIFLLSWMFASGGVSLWPIQALVTLGFLFSLYFLYVQAFVLRAFCTWCVVSFVDFLVMFLAVWFM